MRPVGLAAKAILLPSAIVAAKAAGLGMKSPNGHNGELGGSREGALTDESGGLLKKLLRNPLGILSININFFLDRSYRQPPSRWLSAAPTGLEPEYPGFAARRSTTEPRH